jgi:RimJ/RimL family protein N-acetyltransferase
VRRFIASLPDSDLVFIRDDPTDAATVQRWAAGEPGEWHWVVLGADDELDALVSLVRLRGWASHVGELRIVVRPAARGKGLGSELARFGLVHALRQDLRKVQVHVVADAEQRVEMFRSLGFKPEALLEDHFLSKDGAVHDLMILTYPVADRMAELATYGASEAATEPA